MPQNINTSICELRTENGKQYLYSPSGEKLPMQISTLFVQDTNDALEGRGVCVVTLYVKISDSKKDK